MTDEPKPLTGRKVFYITAGAFAVIIAANLALAWAAIGTFPGLEVANSYVASQKFDRERAAQDALGWTAQARYDKGLLVVTLTGADGALVRPAAISARIGRATSSRDDRAVDLADRGERFVSPIELGGGRWVLWLEAEAPDGTAFRQRLRVTTGGAAE